ncbi:MAG: Crp/Fnr family transcriptional regulator [Clostridia bacterium]|nr:Crp/Fnr family transcriptional regulator [Clostridia bacterium]MBQ4157981.1 Crp/Fnr family transcriptional regulator [Clostridia bacterium]
MTIEGFFTVWNQLDDNDRETLENSAFRQTISKGTVLHNGSQDCTGLICVISGQLRAYILSADGREITLYRLLERDICLFSASCMMRSIQFDITIEAEKESEIYMIPVEVYQSVMMKSAPLANFTNSIMASRFTDVMWLIEQIMWKRFDQRLAAFLVEESALEGSGSIKITHEKIAAHLGTAREVVTRMLKYFQSEGFVKLTRGSIEIIDEKALSAFGE